MAFMQIIPTFHSYPFRFYCRALTPLSLSLYPSSPISFNDKMAEERPFVSSYPYSHNTYLCTSVDPPNQPFVGSYPNIFSESLCISAYQPNQNFPDPFYIPSTSTLLENYYFNTYANPSDLQVSRAHKHLFYSRGSLEGLPRLQNSRLAAYNGRNVGNYMLPQDPSNPNLICSPGNSCFNTYENPSNLQVSRAHDRAFHSWGSTEDLPSSQNSRLADNDDKNVGNFMLPQDTSILQNSNHICSPENSYFNTDENPSNQQTSQAHKLFFHCRGSMEGLQSFQNSELAANDDRNISNCMLPKDPSKLQSPNPICSPENSYFNTDENPSNLQISQAHKLLFHGKEGMEGLPSFHISGLAANNSRNVSNCILPQDSSMLQNSPINTEQALLCIQENYNGTPAHNHACEICQLQELEGPFETLAISDEIQKGNRHQIHKDHRFHDVEVYLQTERWRWNGGSCERWTANQGQRRRVAVLASALEVDCGTGGGVTRWLTEKFGGKLNLGSNSLQITN